MNDTSLPRSSYNDPRLQKLSQGLDISVQLISSAKPRSHMIHVKLTSCFPSISELLEKCRRLRMKLLFEAEDATKPTGLVNGEH